MSMTEQFKSFMDIHKENIKMAMLHGNFDEAMEIVFASGYQAGESDTTKPVIVIDADEVN